VFRFVGEQVLTDRELAILSLVGRGCSDKEIAVQLNLSPKTVSNQLCVAMQKLDARNRTHACHLALALGALATTPAARTTIEKLKSPESA
jgi:DNA-binding NarL/FixJ family response regulator